MNIDFDQPYTIIITWKVFKNSEDSEDSKVTIEMNQNGTPVNLDTTTFQKPDISTYIDTFNQGRSNTDVEYIVVGTMKQNMNFTKTYTYKIHCKGKIYNLENGTFEEEINSLIKTNEYDDIQL